MGLSASHFPAIDLDSPYVTVVVSGNTISILNSSDNVWAAVTRAVSKIQGVGEGKVKLEVIATKKFHRVVYFQRLNKEVNSQQFARNLLKEMGRIEFCVAFSSVVEVEGPKTCLFFEKNIKSEDIILTLSPRKEDRLYVFGDSRDKKVVDEIIHHSEVRVQKTKEAGDSFLYKFKGYPWARGHVSGRRLILHILDRLHCMGYKLTTTVAWGAMQHSLLFKVPKCKNVECRTKKAYHFLVEIKAKDQLNIYNGSEDTQNCIRSILVKNGLIIQAENDDYANCLGFKIKGNLWASRNDATAVYGRVIIMNMLSKLQEQGFSLVATFNIEGGSSRKDEADVFVFNESGVTIKYSEFCAVAFREKNILHLIGGNEDVHRAISAAINNVMPGDTKQGKMAEIAYPNVQFKLRYTFDSSFGWGLVGATVASMSSLGWKLTASVNVSRAHHKISHSENKNYYRIDADTLYFRKPMSRSQVS